MTRIQLTADGKTHTIYRDVCHKHPKAVHAALGTHSEVQLQLYLDQMNVADWYDADGRHLGPDCTGLEMFEPVPV